jgi:hypothetical protein
MIDAHTLKADDAIVYVDIHDFPRAWNGKSWIPFPLTPNKTYKVLKTKYVSSTSIGVTIKADDGNIKEINLYNELGLPRFKRLEDIREEKLRKLGLYGI